MRYFYKIIIFIILFFSIAKAAEKTELTEVNRTVCRTDLDTIHTFLKKDSIIYINSYDSSFQKWYDQGYQNGLKLINLISNQNECLYVIKYYVYGFQNSRIGIKNYLPKSTLKYPGLISAISNRKHYIIYKNPELKYLNDIKIGDEIITINGISTDDYYTDYIIPFYLNHQNAVNSQISASTHLLIIDTNPFKPIPNNIQLKRGELIFDLNLKYLELSNKIIKIVQDTVALDGIRNFKVEKIFEGIWIKIPSFFLNRTEMISFIKMLSQLKYKLAQEDYIVFDMRKNSGGSTEWSRPIVRNLWGDNKLKSLGSKHVYNTEWEKKIRVSQGNFDLFKKQMGTSAAKFYATALRKGEELFLKKWSIFRDKEHLYTNNDSSEFRAKIYILTDQTCNSTCWTFVNEMTQVPGVIHLGQEIFINSVYSYARKIVLPSQKFDFYFPTQIRIKPYYSLGKSLMPQIKYEGNMKHEIEVINWVRTIAE